MTDTVKKTLRDSAAMRWTALLLLTRGWDSKAFGTMQGSEVFLNVFVFFLIFAGIILDKMGVRFTAVLSGAVMFIGGLIKWYAVSNSFIGTGLETWFTNNLNWHTGVGFIDDILPFYQNMPASAKLAAIGFMIFGCGCEMAGITVSRGIVKWFKGRETALAMGSEMALARLGVATCMIFSPYFAKLGGSIDVSRSVAFGVVLLCIGLIMFITYFFMDRKLDSQTGEAEEKDDPFKVKDIGTILASLGFWLVALLCVLYYSAIFPFQKYAVNMLQCNLTLTEPAAGSFWAGEAVTIVQYIIMLVVAGCSFASNFIKENKSLKYGLMAVAVVALVVYCKGKAASMLLIGSILLVVCHLTFAFILPLFKGSAVGGTIVAYVTILVLGASFSLVPAALWPSVPKLVDAKVIGSAYALIFWIQNIGLWLFPILIGNVLTKTNAPGTPPDELNYTWALVMLACLGVASMLIGLYLKAVDKKKHLGLEEPNIQ